MRHRQVIDGSAPYRPMRLNYDAGLAMDMLHNVARTIVAGARRAINKGGRLGRMRSDGQRASVPGEAPHKLTGELSSSLSIREAGLTIVQIGSSSDHARVHEFGDRPFLKPEVPKAMLADGDAVGLSISVK